MSGTQAQARGELTRGSRFIVACSMGVICSSIVLPYHSIGTLVGPVTEAFGWTRAEFQAAILFSSGLGALTAPIVGWLIDRYGVRKVGIPSLVGLAVGFLVAASMDGSLWMLYTAYAAVAILGAGTIPVTWTQAISHQFFERRGMALGITLSGTGVCAMLMPFYCVWLLDEFGWRGAYVGIAALPVLLALPLVYFWMRPFPPAESSVESSAPESGMTLREAAGGYRFWLLMTTIFLAYMGFSGIGPNLIVSLTDDGMSNASAASVYSVFGAAILIGRLVVGYLVDRYWAPAVACASLILPAVGSLMFVGAPDYLTACVAAFFFGFAAGAELDLMSFLTARYFGLLHYGKIYSVMYATLAVCSGTAPMLFAWVYDVTSSYDIGFQVTSVLFALSAGAILLLGRYPQRTL